MNYAVSVEPGAKLVAGPYVAETFPVTVEDGYLYLVVDVVDVASNAASRKGAATAR